MKWIALLGLIALTPVLVALFRSTPKYLLHAGFVMGLFPYIFGRFNLGAAPISWVWWPGYSKGVEVNLIDALAVAVLLGTTVKVKAPLLLKISFGLLFFSVLLAALLSAEKQPSFFYVWQVLKSGILCVAVARASMQVPDFPLAMISGAMLGVFLNAGAATIEYLGGDYQAGGWFGHQNLLGMATHFVVYSAFALLLANKHPKKALVIVICGLLIAYTGASRATIGLLGIGLALATLLSLWNYKTSRKYGFAIAGFLALLAVSPVLLGALERRSPEGFESSNDERRRMEQAASMMLSDYPLGVGPNRYVVVANVEGYSARAGVAWNEANRSAPVHNTYRLFAAEMGWLGLFSLYGFIVSIIFVTISTMRKVRHRIEGDILAGTSAALLVLTVHMNFEFITMDQRIHYLVAMVLGFVIATNYKAKVGAQQRQAAPLRRRPAPAEVPA